MKSDCQNLKESSVAVRNWILKQPAVKEESITDWLLYDISENISNITYYAFTRHDEARETGADWEWWFLFPNFSVKMRVQAKKIDPMKDNYPIIAYANHHGLQIEKLLEDSAKKNFIPLYAFYTSIQDKVLCALGINDEGVFIVGGKRIYIDFVKNGRNYVQPEHIISRCVPLSCLICCELCSSSPDGFVNFLAYYFYSEMGYETQEQAENANKQKAVGIYAKIPNYVSTFIERSSQDSPARFEFEEEFRYDLEGTNALVIYDARS